MSNTKSTINNKNWIPNPLVLLHYFGLTMQNSKKRSRTKVAYELQFFEENIRNRYETLATELDHVYNELCHLLNDDSNAVAGNSIPNYFQVELCEFRRQD